MDPLKSSSINNVPLFQCSLCKDVGCVACKKLIPKRERKRVTSRKRKFNQPMPSLINNSQLSSFENSTFSSFTNSNSPSISSFINSTSSNLGAETISNDATLSKMNCPICQNTFHTSEREMDKHVEDCLSIQLLKEENQTIIQQENNTSNLPPTPQIIQPFIPAKKIPIEFPSPDFSPSIECPYESCGMKFPHECEFISHVQDHKNSNHQNLLCPLCKNNGYTVHEKTNLYNHIFKEHFFESDEENEDEELNQKFPRKISKPNPVETLDHSDSFQNPLPYKHPFLSVPSMPASSNQNTAASFITSSNSISNTSNPSNATTEQASFEFIEQTLEKDLDEECCICLETFAKGSLVARLECICLFHKECILDWFQKDKSCPNHQKK